MFTSTTNFISSTSANTTTETKSFIQTLDLNWNKAISPTLRYRLTLRGEDARNEVRENSDLTRGFGTQFEPIFDATLAGNAFSLNGGIRLRELLTDGTEQDRIWLSERRWFTRLFLTPQELPTLSFQVDGVTQKNDARLNPINQTDTRYQISSDYNYRGLTFSYLFTDQIKNDFAGGVTRDQKSNIGTLGYTGSSLWGWLDVLAGYNINYSPTHERFSKSGKVEVEQPLSRGLKAAADFTPEDSSDVPLTSEPGLLNGTAAILLEQRTSLGFEQPSQPPKPVSKVRLTLTPVGAFIIPTNIQNVIKFKVFVSDKPDPNSLNAWTEVTCGFVQTYDSLESRLELTWNSCSPPPTPTARFLKLWVDANPFDQQIQVTRITAINDETVIAGTTRDQSSLLHNVNGSFTIRPPTRPWTISALSYDFNFLSLTQQPGSLRNMNGTHTARLVAEPYRNLTSIFSYQHSFANSNQEDSKDTTADLYTLVFSSTPLPTLTSSLTIAHNDNRGDGKLETRSDSGSLYATARVYRNLNVDSTYTVARIQDFLADQKTLSHLFTTNANAVLTSRLNALLGYSLNWAETEEPEKTTTRLTHILNGSFTYTISRLLNFNVRYNLLTSKDIMGFHQDYRIDWTPTPKLSAFVGYHRTNDESNGAKSTSDSVTVNGRWNISRYLSLDGNFFFFKDSASNTIYSLSGRVQVRF